MPYWRERAAHRVVSLMVVHKVIKPLGAGQQHMVKRVFPSPSENLSPKIWAFCLWSGKIGLTLNWQTRSQHRAQVPCLCPPPPLPVLEIDIWHSITSITLSLAAKHSNANLFNTNQNTTSSPLTIEYGTQHWTSRRLLIIAVYQRIKPNHEDNSVRDGEIPTMQCAAACLYKNNAPGMDLPNSQLCFCLFFSQRHLSLDRNLWMRLHSHSQVKNITIERGTEHRSLFIAAEYRSFKPNNTCTASAAHSFLFLFTSNLSTSSLSMQPMRLLERTAGEKVSWRRD